MVKFQSPLPPVRKVLGSDCKRVPDSVSSNDNFVLFNGREWYILEFVKKEKILFTLSLPNLVIWVCKVHLGRRLSCMLLLKPQISGWFLRNFP